MNILVVEDDPILGNLLQKLMQDLIQSPICEVRLATTAAEGMSHLHRDETFSVLITDFNLGTENSVQILADAQKLGIPKRILISGSESMTQQKALQLGATHFLKKPLDTDLLIKLVG